MIFNNFSNFVSKETHIFHNDRNRKIIISQITHLIINFIFSKH